MSYRCNVYPYCDLIHMLLTPRRNFRTACVRFCAHLHQENVWMSFVDKMDDTLFLFYLDNHNSLGFEWCENVSYVDVVARVDVFTLVLRMAGGINANCMHRFLFSKTRIEDIWWKVYLIALTLLRIILDQVQVWMDTSSMKCFWNLVLYIKFAFVDANVCKWRTIDPDTKLLRQQVIHWGLFIRKSSL